MFLNELHVKYENMFHVLEARKFVKIFLNVIFSIFILHRILHYKRSGTKEP